MESTWAGDYPDNNYNRYWTDERRKPYIIHWAGCQMNLNRPIDILFTTHLTAAEKQRWDSELEQKITSQNTFYRRMRRNLSRVRKAFSDISYE